MDRRPFRFAGRIVTMVEADFSVALHPADRAREADNPHSLVVRFGMDKPLALDAGIELAPFQIAYQTYGSLNAERSNAVLICHALTGDQHVANFHPVTQKPGWWETMVGPGRPIDTERYFVICPNVLGACMGTTGPASTNPKTGMPWVSSSPSSPFATWCARRPCCSTTSGSPRCSQWLAARWAACRCCNGARAIRGECSRRFPSPPRPAIRRRTLPSTRSAGRR